MRHISENDIAWLADAVDLLSRYAEYSGEMRKIGRGHCPCSEHAPESILANAKRIIDCLME